MRKFTELANTTEKTRSSIYDVFATYNIIIQDAKCRPAFEMIQKEYNYLNLPSLGEEEFNTKLDQEFKREFSVSLNDVIDACENDGIFLDLVQYVKK